MIEAIREKFEPVTKIPRKVLILLSTFVLGIAACGGDTDNHQSNYGTRPEPIPTPGPVIDHFTPESSPTRTWTISQEDFTPPAERVPEPSTQQ